jgi:HPt (histidine-containing phosphotransfer) domain-containing protein/two-component sensor histidine kinase
VYYALGAFNVISVLAAIALSYKAMSGFSGSIEINEQWAARLGAYSELAQTASRADGPGNDVFADNDVDGETAKLVGYRTTFFKQLDAAIADLVHSVSPPIRVTLVAKLEMARSSFTQMMAQADQIFPAFRRDRAEAGAHMAAMDARFSDVSEALNDLLGAVRAIQQAQFRGQQAESEGLQTIGHGLVLLVVLIVVAVVAYGRKLALMFARQQATIDAKNRDMRLVLDHVAQGFVTINLHGVMSDERSAVMDRWFTAPAAGATLMSHLEARCPEFTSSLGLGLGELRDDIMPPELLLEQLPHRFKLEHRIYDVSYTPISPRGKIEQLLVVISDVTDSVARETGDREQREVVRIFQRITIDRGGVEEFLREAGTLVTELRAEHDPVIQKRLVHTLKGNCAIYGMDSYAALAQQVENELADTGGGLSDEQRTILVEMWRQAMRRVASLLGGPRRDIIEIERGELTAARELSAGPELAALLESWTHEPVTRRFERLAMHVGDIARRVGKPEPQIEFQTSGIRLEPEGWTPFWAAMVHVVRNAVDHGIEPETVRVAAGKPAAGKITMTASHEDGQLVLKIRDDGRGVDWDRVRTKARALGLPCETEADLTAAVFHDGLSTRDQVSDISGRGVGLAALSEVVTQLGGQCSLSSELGRGTTLTFRFGAAVRPSVSERQARSSLVPHFS